MKILVAAPALARRVLADVLRRLTQSLACSTHSRRMLHAQVQPLLPRVVHGIFLNYVDHERPHLFSRPLSSPTFPGIDSLLDFIPEEHRGWWSVRDHCNGILLCHMEFSGRLCVCNPATRQWELLPPHEKAWQDADEAAYILFCPVSSPHYEVVLIPPIPTKPKPPNCNEKVAEDGPHDEDPCRLMEWPPTPWTLLMFSSRTRQWEERSFVREGEPMGVVEDMRSDPSKLTFYGPRQRYAVYSKGVDLYVHCRGCFVMRLSLSDDKYQVIKTPANIKHTKPYFGTLGNRVCFGVTHDEGKLSVWILNESRKHVEWVLKYEDDLTHIAKHVGRHDRQMNGGAWILREHHCKASETAPTESSEWDSDNDDIFQVDNSAESYFTSLDILGFHPYKEVVFLAQRFTAVAYHLSSSKVQYLGNTRPDCYYLNHCNGVYESFVYTPCMIGQLEQNDMGQLEDADMYNKSHSN